MGRRVRAEQMHDSPALGGAEGGAGGDAIAACGPSISGRQRDLNPQPPYYKYGALPIAPCRLTPLILPVTAAEPHSASLFSEKFSEIEFMQYRSPVGVPNPSGNTCPRCEPQFAQRTSVRAMPRESSSSSCTASGRTDS